MADKMSLNKVYEWLNAFRIKDEEQRRFIIDSRHLIAEHETAEAIVQLSRGKSIQWIRNELYPRMKDIEKANEEKVR